MHHEKQGTLARIIGSPFRKTSKINVTSKDLAEVLLAADKNAGKVVPDSEAVRFYALNQLLSLILPKFTPNEVLPEFAANVVEAYEQELIAQHRRMLWYTFLIVTREFRHLSGAKEKLVSPTYPPELAKFHSHITDSTDETTLNGWLKYMPAIDLEQYCDYITKQFDTKGWYGGGFGGKPWGNISRTIQKYVGGQTSAEVFIDTAYTLAHNNGPMFNKGMMYNMYTNVFKKILDVQRSGQICEGLLENTIPQWVTVEGSSQLVSLIWKVREELGGVGEYIDWYKLEKLGSVAKYPAEKMHQDKKYGKASVKKLIDGKPVKTKGEFEVFPGQTVEIYERLAA